MLKILLLIIFSVSVIIGFYVAIFMFVNKFSNIKNNYTDSKNTFLLNVFYPLFRLQRAMENKFDMNFCGPLFCKVKFIFLEIIFLILFLWIIPLYLSLITVDESEFTLNNNYIDLQKTYSRLNLESSPEYYNNIKLKDDLSFSIFTNSIEFYSTKPFDVTSTKDLILIKKLNIFDKTIRYKEK